MLRYKRTIPEKAKPTDSKDNSEKNANWIHIQLHLSLVHLLKRLWVCYTKKVSQRVKLYKADCREHNDLDEIAENHLNIEELYNYSSRDIKVMIVLTETHSSRSFSQQTRSLIVSVLYFLHCSSDCLWNRQQRRSHHSQSFPSFPLPLSPRIFLSPDIVHSSKQLLLRLTPTVEWMFWPSGPSSLPLCVHFCSALLDQFWIL